MVTSPFLPFHSSPNRSHRPRLLSPAPPALALPPLFADASPRSVRGKVWESKRGGSWMSDFFSRGVVLRRARGARFGPASSPASPHPTSFPSAFRDSFLPPRRGLRPHQGAKGARNQTQKLPPFSKSTLVRDVAVPLRHKNSLTTHSLHSPCAHIFFPDDRTSSSSGSGRASACRHSTPGTPPSAAPELFSMFGDIPANVPTPVTPLLAARIDEMQGAQGSLSPQLSSLSKRV